MADHSIITRFLFVVAATVIIILAIILPIVLLNRNPTSIPSVVEPSLEPEFSETPDTSSVFVFSEPDQDDDVPSSNETPDSFPDFSPSFNHPSFSLEPPADSVVSAKPVPTVQPPPQTSKRPSSIPTTNEDTDKSKPGPTIQPTFQPSPTASPRVRPNNDGPHFIARPHIAHAVPGRHYIADDVDGNKIEFVRLDASRSHSHFFEAEPKPRLASIEQWMWYDSNGSLLANSSTPVLIFPVGTSKLSLSVRDNFGHSHSDVTNVTVNPHTVSGIYCYFYQLRNSNGLYFSLDQNIVVGAKPLFSQLFPTNASFTSEADVPAIFRNIPFQVRCTFQVPPTNSQTRSLRMEHRGPLRVLMKPKNLSDVSHNLLFESMDAGLKNSTIPLQIPPHGAHLQLWYLRSQDNAPYFRILGDFQQATHDLSDQLPVIRFIRPANSTLGGGGLLTVHGSGFWNDANVYFDNKIITRIDARSDRSTLTVKVPPVAKPKNVTVSIGNRIGSSNSVEFRYSEDALSPIVFEERQLRHSAQNKTFETKLITNVKWGPDHRLYLASLDSFVHSLSVSRELTVSDYCSSRSLGRGRTVIGLAFNPAEDNVVLYASSSVIFWEKYDGRNDVLNSVPWANGKVHRLAPGHDGHCLGVIGQPIITGLPVSNHDHAVYGMVFDDDGKLIIQVGSATNAGVSDVKFGGVEESPLSAASVIADVNRLGFDGHVRYSSNKSSVARVVSGDIEIYAPGWRSSFDITTHSNGFIYATDNGANPEFGNRSNTCDTEAPISPYNSDDRLVRVIRGRYGGHPNRNRARDDPVQCTWRGPFEKRSMTYNAPIATLQSSTDGLIEYTADLFEGQMKGNLLASKYSSNDKRDEGRVYRIRLNHEGSLKGKVESLWEASGLSIVMTPWGDLISPRVYDTKVLVLKAIHKNEKAGRLIAVTPFRGPKRGGNVVLVTGWKLGRGSVAIFGYRPCTDVRYRDEDSFHCTVPAGEAGISVRVAIRLANGMNVASSGGFDYRYMRI